LTDAQLLLAKARWLASDTTLALKEITDIIKKEPTMVEAHILAAVINSESGNMKSADQSLKQAFSQDFLIRDNPVFMLMRSDIEMKQKDFAAALKTLEYAFNLP
jgi:hypothetical protein